MLIEEQISCRLFLNDQGSFIYYLIPIGKSGSIIIIPWHSGLVGLFTRDGFAGRPISNFRKMMNYTYMSCS
jgi:hypothetical protein